MPITFVVWVWYFSLTGFPMLWVFIPKILIGGSYSSSSLGFLFFLRYYSAFFTSFYSIRWFFMFLYSFVSIVKAIWLKQKMSIIDGYPMIILRFLQCFWIFLEDIFVGLKAYFSGEFYCQSLMASLRSLNTNRFS